MAIDCYLTISEAVTFEFKEKGSRFIGQAVPAFSREQAEQFIAAIKKNYHDATHNCFAYRIGIGDRQISRYYDDGEPSGTAGKPILHAIIGKGLTNLCLVVTRYFGGTKLGTGGLARAYSFASQQALEHAKVKKCYVMSSVVIKFTYEYASTVYRIIEINGGEIIKQNYSDVTELTVEVRESLVDQVMAQLTEKTAGQVVIIKNGD